MSDPAVPAADQPWRIALTCALFAGLFALVAGRLHHLQMEKGENLAELGERQRLRKLEIQAARGNLYDVNGTPLAVSDGRWSLYADPGYMDDRLRATVELAPILGVARDHLRKEFESRYNGRRIAKGLDDKQADAVRALKLGGLALRREFVRLYPEGSLAVHVLGYVLADGTGGAGTEQRFDHLMRGTPGVETISVDAFGAPSVIDGESRPARPGAHVQLTIDVPVQRALEQALLEAADRHRPQGIAGIIIRPRTGEVVAMASWPTFDPAQLAELKPEAARNNAIGFPYEPGSTIKPLLIGGAAADRLLTWSERIWCENGVYRIPGRAKPVRDHSWKHGGHQWLNPVEGIAKSDNVLAVKVVQRLGPERAWHWARSFGLGRATGFILPGEERGLLQPPERWSASGSIPSVAQGYELMVTPLQMAMAHAAIANRGTWLPPRLVRRIWQMGEDGRERELPLPPLPETRRVLATEDALQIQQAMTATMIEGTAKKSSLVGYSSAGKTGTAVKVVNGRYDDNHHVGSFVCWTPANPLRDPEFLALVVVDDPAQNGHYGGETAAPIAQKVLQFALERFAVIPDQPVVEPGVAVLEPVRPAVRGGRR